MVNLIEYLPLATGSMIFVSIRFARDRADPRRLIQAWYLGLGAQLLLFAFGAATGHWAFIAHLVVAAAFAWNIVDHHRKSERQQMSTDKKPDPAKPPPDTKRKDSGTEREATERWDQRHAPKYGETS